MTGEGGRDSLGDLRETVFSKPYHHAGARAD
jgi:hypothetical protein